MHKHKTYYKISGGILLFIFKGSINLNIDSSKLLFKNSLKDLISFELIFLFEIISL